MRLNLPVSPQEFEVREGMSIVSRTDLKGVITYVNEDFVEASGYEEHELLGQPHNLLRHPDMPEAVFADLWATLKAGRPWRGLVKNRRKDGGFYWVLANVTPIREGGRSVGYLSVRTRAPAEDIKLASDAYRRLREGSAGRLRLCQGQIVEGGACRARWQETLHGSSIAPRLALASLLLVLPLCILLVLLLRSLNGELQLAERGRQGLELHRAMALVVQHMQVHRGLTALYFSGDENAATRLAAKSQEAGRAWQRLLEIETRQGDLLGTAERSKNLRAQWETTQGRAMSIEFRASIDAQTAIIDQGFALMLGIADRSGLTVASHLDSRYASDILVYRLPQLVKPMGESRAYGLYAASRKSASEDLQRPIFGLHTLALANLAAIERNIEAAGENNPTLAQHLRQAQTVATQTISRFLALVEQRLLAAARTDGATPTQFLNEATAAIDASFQLYEQTASGLDAVFASRAAALQQRLVWLGGGIALLVLCALGFGALLLHDLLATLRRSVNHLDRIAEGHFRDAIDTAREDELGEVLKGQQVMQVHAGFELAEARRLMNRSERRKVGLDAVSKGVLLSDAGGRIIYANEQLRRNFAAAAADFATVRRGFEVSRLLDYKVSDLLPGGEALWATLTQNNAMTREDFDLGTRHFRVSCSPVMEDGRLLGHAVEWLDRTEELAVEREVAAMLTAAAQGDFSVRLALQDKQGFFRELAQSVNRLLELSQSGLAEIARVIAAIARGDLTEKISGEYSGT
ncbi:MAG: PAS domain-containing protein, partial [Burkholderiales bacterium]